MSSRDVGIVLFVVFLWSLNFISMAKALEFFPPVLLAALRFVCAAFPAVFFVSRSTVPTRFFVLYGGLFGVVYFPVLFAGVQAGMPPGLTSLVLQSQALFTVLFTALLLKDSPTRRQFAGIALAFAGIGLIVREMGTSPAFVGLLLVLLAASLWGYSNIMLKQYGQGVNMLALMVWSSLVPVVPLLCLSFLLEDGQMALFTSSAQHVDKALAIAGVLFMGLGGTVVGFGLWGNLLRRYSPNVVAPFSLLVPVFGMFFASLFFGEEYTRIKIIASVLILAGLALTVLKKPT